MMNRVTGYVQHWPGARPATAAIRTWADKLETRWRNSSALMPLATTRIQQVAGCRSRPRLARGNMPCCPVDQDFDFPGGKPPLKPARYAIRRKARTGRCIAGHLSVILPAWAGPQARFVEVI